MDVAKFVLKLGLLIIPLEQGKKYIEYTPLYKRTLKKVTQELALTSPEHPLTQ